MDLRKQGAPKKEGRAILAPTGPFAELGETQIPGDQIAALRALYHANPSMQAARSILLGQLLSSGIVVRRKGEDVALTESFAKHLEGVWLPFARQCFDELMVQGFVTVSIEEEPPEPFAAVLEKRRGGKRPRGPANTIPVVTEPGTVQVSFLRAGRNGYARRYAAKSLAPGVAYGFDDEIGIFVRGHPDSSGNIRSPVATCFNSASFVAALMELALQAEVVRARTLLVTQVAQRPGNNGTAPLSAADLFYDSESRALQHADAQGEAQEQAASLNLLTKLCARLNQLQTTNQPGSSGPPPATHAPPEVPPRLFTLPEKQQLAPAPQQPQSRTDLEALLRQSNDAVCAAFGVPASVIFEGKFSSNSMSQLQLLNTTVASLAITMNSILTACYHACYETGTTEEDELMLVTAPISATSEVEALFTAGIIDWKIAIPASLHSLGCSANEITEALRRRGEEEDKKAAVEDATKAAEVEAGRVGNEKAKVEVEKTKAEVEKTKEETKQVGKPAPSSGSSPGSSGSK